MGAYCEHSYKNSYNGIPVYYHGTSYHLDIFTKIDNIFDVAILKRSTSFVSFHQLPSVEAQLERPVLSLQASRYK